ncbi:uncharacterized protein LOC112175703 [Rosa chinensis]|uniref:uncharacterized protein LOC112175703 n=1 Tax=Rosa chinensis TaxID=74649 RepID=UPI001AD8AB47|nr:uncharacterized protein LOC112175703 [Rosa chinensis]
MEEGEIQHRLHYPTQTESSQKEAIIPPEAEHEDTDLVGDIEQSLDFSHHATLFQQQTGYFLMQLDSVDVGEPLNDNAAEGDTYIKLILRISHCLNVMIHQMHMQIC